MQARQVLHKLLQKVCSEMHKMRRTALFVNVMAALRGEVLTVTHLGRSITSEAKEKHCIKRADRLLSNRRLQGERVEIYSALTQQLIGMKQRPVIIVDWSDMDECKRHFLLRASVPIEGRSLVTSKEKPKTHQRFLQRLEAMLPPDCRPILVSDAGFRTPWFKQVEAFGWDWVGRIRNRHEVQRPGEEEWIPCKSLYPQATSTPKALGRARLTRSNPIDCHLVLYKGKPKGRVHLNRLGNASRSTHNKKHQKVNREPWLLGTSLSEGFKIAEKAVKLYGDAITQWACVNQPNVKLSLEPKGGGFYFLKFPHSGKCVHQHGATQGDGDPITQWECVDQPNVLWKFIPAPN